MRVVVKRQLASSSFSVYDNVVHFFVSRLDIAS